MRFLVLSTVDVCHHSHQLVYRERLLKRRLGSVANAKILTLMARNMSTISEKAYLFREPVRTGPELFTLRTFVQASVNNQDRGSRKKGSSCIKISISAAFIAPCTNLRVSFKA